MHELIKIKDMTGRYDISARTLRYYEDMGLLASTRSGDYAYRLYDEAAVKRLEQILILRRLNISIKDIQRVFSASGAETVLEVLGKKVGDIDDEVALLHELKEIILEFRRQIKDADFGSDSDVKLLYEKARDIEARIANVDYNGNPSNVNRLLEVTEKLEQMPDAIRKYPRFSMCFHGLGSDEATKAAFALYEEAFGAINTWEEQPYNSGPGNLHIMMEINGFEILLKTQGGKHPGDRISCQMDFDGDDGLRRAYDALAQDGQGEWLEPAPHAPLSAFVTDKFGVGWWLHT
jgi:DNA-binding transcriptional MerR regulator/uncharacterized glyoxalase superfamily protein PhnB